MTALDDGRTFASTSLPITDIRIDLFLNQNVSSLEESPQKSGLVSDEVNYIFTIINYIVLCAGVSLFGIGTNIINIIVFIRLGFKETINISFFGMAVSDLIMQFSTLWICVCTNPWFLSSDIPFKDGDALYFTVAWAQVITTRMTSWITAFVTLERCLCIVIPLKIKEIITATRTKIITFSILIVSIACVVPVYFTIDIQWQYDVTKNKSLLALVIKESRRDMQNTLFNLNNIAFPLISFAAVFVCTIILSISLKRTSKLRKKMSAATKEGSRKVRDQTVIKMVAGIAVIYIVCYSPNVITFLLLIGIPDFFIGGRYENIFYIASSFCFLFESINSCLNIFIYYFMSSKYRNTFNALFSKKSI